MEKTTSPFPSQRITPERILDILSGVADPEIPVLTVLDMGIVRGVQIESDESVLVRITPTYSGCPAMNVIEADISTALRQAGIPQFRVETDFREVWTTDWMSDEALVKLKDYGIAPPERSKRYGRREADGEADGEGVDPSTGAAVPPDDDAKTADSTKALGTTRLESRIQALLEGWQSQKIVPCPLCDSLETRRVSEFGSTPCKSQYQCDSCLNPFEHFKCI